MARASGGPLRGPAARLVDWLLPRRCVCCDALGVGICGDCAARLVPPPPAPPPEGVDELVALASYEGTARRVVLALKRGNRRDAVEDLGDALFAGVRAVLPLGPVQVTWAPTTPQRRRRRGFDQAEMLARAVARSGGRACGALLERRAPPQMGRNEAERRHGPSFEARGRVPGVVVLVDDVSTTGATLTAAAIALRRAGAHTVVAAVIAVTP